MRVLRKEKMTKSIKESIQRDSTMVTTTKIQELQNGALIATIPKALAGALGYEKGTIISWKLEGGRLYIEKV